MLSQPDFTSNIWKKNEKLRGYLLHAAISLRGCGYLVIIPVQPTDGSVKMLFDSCVVGLMILFWAKLRMAPRLQGKQWWISVRICDKQWRLQGKSVVYSRAPHIFVQIDAFLQAVVDSTSSGRSTGTKKPRTREMSARSYALHSVCPRLSYFSLLRIAALICLYLYILVTFHANRIHVHTAPHLSRHKWPVW